VGTTQLSSALLIPEASGGTGTTTGYYGFKNRIINGAMVIDQRNAGASVSVQTTTGYALDRWACLTAVNSKYSIQQNAGSVTPPAGYINYLGVTVGASAGVTVGATDQYLIRQLIEGFNVADFAYGTASASPVTLSFWIRSSVTGTYGGALVNNAGDRSYPFTYTINSANTWEQKTVTVAGITTGTWVTNNGNGLNVSFSLGVGSTYSGTAGSWASTYYASATGAVKLVETNSATWYVTGVQLEKGSTATSFDYRPLTTEQQLCYRYCYRWTASIAYSYCSFIRQYSTTNGTALIKLPVAMRGTISGSTIAINSANWDYSVTAINPVSNQSADNNFVQCDVTGTFAGASYCGALGSNNTAQPNWIQWTSEL
jgi:hypothetical protein